MKIRKRNEGRKEEEGKERKRIKGKKSKMYAYYDADSKYGVMQVIAS